MDDHLCDLCPDSSGVLEVWYPEMETTRTLSCWRCNGKGLLTGRAVHIPDEETKTRAVEAAVIAIQSFFELRRK